MHGLGLLLFKRRSLKNHISFIQELDNVWLRDTMENELNLEELKTVN